MFGLLFLVFYIPDDPYAYGQNINVQVKKQTKLLFTLLIWKLSVQIMIKDIKLRISTVLSPEDREGKEGQEIKFLS